MEALVRLALLAALCLSVEGRVFGASHFEEGEAEDLCAATAPAAVSCADVSSADGLAAHPGDCRLFVQCVDASAAPICLSCPAGLHFNPALHVCDRPEHAGCGDSSVVPEVEGALPAAPEVPVRCAELGVPESCAAGDDALLPHPGDCALFLYCVGGAPVCRQCSPGLHFNPALNVCDAPAVAGCSLSPEPGPIRSDGADGTS